MGTRRRTDLDWIPVVFKVILGLAVLTFIYPPIRQSLSVLAMLAIAFALLVSLAVLSLRSVFKNRNSHAGLRVYDLEKLEVVPQQKPIKPGGDAADLPAVKTPPLIQQLHSIDWFQFEKLVAAIYNKLGYSTTRRGGANPDGGIDLMIKKDGAQIAVQCKHWKTRDVGVRAVREFVGALTDAGLKNGILVTLGGYTGEARQLAERRGIEILNESGLTALIEAAGAMSDPKVLALLTDPTRYCPKCERVMVLRTAVKGPNSGSQFWGCSNYPACQFTMSIS